MNKITFLIDRNTKKSRGTAFVSLKNEESMKSVLELNDQELNERKLRITNCANR